ncbi:MAG: hypothetical protein AAF368_00760 [Planctomycetota bacterium]
MTEQEEYDDYEDGYEDFEGDAMPITAVGAAAVGAVLGAAAWAALAYYAHIELSYLAVGVGALIGFLAVKAGGRGVPMAVVAAVFAFASIFAGKYIAAQIWMIEYRDQIEWEPITLGDYEERKVDAADWVALENKESDEDVKEYLFQHAFTEGTETPAEMREVLDFFRQFQAPELESFHAESPLPEDWLAAAQAIRDEERASVEATIEEELSPLNQMKADLDPRDLIFLGVGIAAAFGLVSKA